MLADGPQYRLIDLGQPTWLDPPSANEMLSSRAWGINDVGAIVGEFEVDIDGVGVETRAFVWVPDAMYDSRFSSKGMYDLKHVFQTGEAESVARDLTDDGIVVGWRDGWAQAWDLVTLNGPIDVVDVESEAYAITMDDSGPVVTYWVVGDLLNEFNAFRADLFGTSKYVFDELEAAGGPVACPEGEYTEVTARDVMPSGHTVGAMIDHDQSFCPEACTDNWGQAAAWEYSATQATAFEPLFVPPVEEIPLATWAYGVNTQGNAVGRSFNLEPEQPQCISIAAFWEGLLEGPVGLPDFEHGDDTHANAVRDQMSDGEIQVVGRSQGLDAAVLWRGIPDEFDELQWSAIDLNDDQIVCFPDDPEKEWDRLLEATAINDNGWIVGQGVRDGQTRAFLLVPTAGKDACVGDLNLDCVVNVADLLILINAWGDCDDCCDCPADLTGNCEVNVADLLKLINHWGPCEYCPEAPVQSLSDVLDEAGLTQEDWDAYIAVLEGEDESAKRNWNCWMSNYLSGCTTCPTCPGPDPFGDVSGEN